MRLLEKTLIQHEASMNIVAVEIVIRCPVGQIHDNMSMSGSRRHALSCLMPTDGEKASICSSFLLIFRKPAKAILKLSLRGESAPFRFIVPTQRKAMAYVDVLLAWQLYTHPFSATYRCVYVWVLPVDTPATA